MAEKPFADLTIPEMCAWHMAHGADKHSIQLLAALVVKDTLEMAQLSAQDVAALEEALPGFTAQRERTLAQYGAYHIWAQAQLR